MGHQDHKKKVLITNLVMQLPSEQERVWKIARSWDYDYHMFPVKQSATKEQLLPIIHDYEALLCGDDTIDKDVLDQAKKLKVIVKWGTGTDSIDKEQARIKGIKVYNTPNAFTIPVAETTLGLMLALTRQIVKMHSLTSAGAWDKPILKSLSSCVVGIIGFGHIGQEVAKKLHAFHCSILIYDLKTFSRETLGPLGAKQVDLTTLLETSHIITLHTDLNPTSYHLLDAKAFLQMKQNPIIINTSRGPIIEEDAFIHAIKEGIISGAGLDVFMTEPLPPNHPFLSMNQVLLSPHHSNCSRECWDHVHLNSLQKIHEGLSS